MGNENELQGIEEELKCSKDKSKKIKNNENLSSKHLSILERYSNYEPNFLNISLKALESEFKDLIPITKFKYSQDNLIKLDPATKYENFETKQNIFKNCIQSLKIDWREGSDIITINRDKIIESSMDELSKSNIDNCMESLYILIDIQTLELLIDSITIFLE
jgi:hypothetical protein